MGTLSKAACYSPACVHVEGCSSLKSEHDKQAPMGESHLVFCVCGFCISVGRGRSRIHCTEVMMTAQMLNGEMAPPGVRKGSKCFTLLENFATEEKSCLSFADTKVHEIYG